MKVLVTGCQRSGTRFYAKYLATKHNLLFVDEEDYDVRNFHKLLELLKGKSNWSVHGPALKHAVPQFSREYPDAKIIWMKRDREETIASMRRIKWRRSAFTELENLIHNLRSEAIPDALWCDIYSVVRDMAERLGEIYDFQGLVTIKNMAELESLEGFRKYGGSK